jgi:hypothetical protein
VASSDVSGFIFFMVNVMEMRKEFLSLCNVIFLEEYVCSTACNKLAALLRCANSKRICVENMFVPLRGRLGSLPLLDVEHAKCLKVGATCLVFFTQECKAACR